MNIREIFKGILGFILFFILSYLPTIIFDILNIDTTNWNANLVYLFNIFFELLIVFVIALIFRSTIINNFKEYFSKPKEYLSKYIKYWFLALTLMYVSNFIIILITKDIAANEQSVRDLFQANPFFTFILAALIAPILEELVFRLSVYKVLNKIPYVYIVISGLIFGAMHIVGTVDHWTDILYLVPYSIPGCIFAYTLVKSNNIFVPISLHLIHNTFALLIQVIATLQ